MSLLDNPALVRNGGSPSPLWREVNAKLPQGVTPGDRVLELYLAGFTWDEIGWRLKEDLDLDSPPVKDALHFWARVEPSEERR